MSRPKPARLLASIRDKITKRSMNKKFLLIILIILVLGAVYLLVKNQKNSSQKETPTAKISVANFEGCAAAGYPVMQSYPRRCKTPDGKTFTEDIGNELEKQDMIQVEKPRPNASVKSPLSIQGKARGGWFFEASFPIKIYDENETLLGSTTAQAQGEWMTDEFVDFKARLEFKTPTTKKGKLILEKDNPSGIPENTNQLEIPIIFE